MVKIECVVEAGNYLGEGPVWDPVEGVLYWVDMLDKEVWRLDPRTGKTHTWTLPKTVGAFALREQGGGVLTMRDGFYFMDLESGETQLVALVDADEPRSLFNDGKVDRRGRFFAGGEDEISEAPICGLFRLDPDLTVHRAGAWHHLQQRAELEPRQQDLLSHRFLHAGDLRLRLRFRDRRDLQ